MSSRFEIGKLSDILGRPVVLILILAQLALAVAFASEYHARQSSDGCLFCHADRARMEKEGFPQFYLTAEQVEKESKMPGVKCLDCHLGDGRSHDKDTAHKGMLRPLVLDQDLNAVPRKGRMDRLIPTGSDRMYALFPKTEYEGEQVPDPDIFTILWHDRDPVTLGYDPKIAEKTCGKKGCHPQEVAQFSKTVMGGNVRQRSMRFWTDTHGPNNCGPSFADLPPDGGAAAGFSGANYKLVKGETSCPSSLRDATDRQRFCNVCHAGCLDCHYNPTAKEGAHAFTRRVPSTTCTGGGRGTGMCHSGSQERRRGDSYLGAEFSQPPGLPADAHVKKMECMDCHETGEKGMGDMQRRVDCSGCHYFAVKALEGSVHGKLRCQACHVSILGGYAMTVWGRGHVAGRESPFKKYSLYYGITESPILIKDREGFWTPYKVFPNIATNFAGDAKKHEGIDFRWPGGETRDAYAFLGTYPNPGADKALTWLQVEAVGHPLGKSRSCRSCHGSAAQKAKARWEYLGFAGSEPFTGEHTLVADGRGLRVEGFRNTSPFMLMGDARLSDFAAWKGMGDIWQVGGDFSVPKSDARKYKAFLESERAFSSRIKTLEPGRGSGDEKTKARLKKIKDLGTHDPEQGLSEMEKAGF